MTSADKKDRRLASLLSVVTEVNWGAGKTNEGLGCPGSHAESAESQRKHSIGDITPFRALRQKLQSILQHTQSPCDS